MITPASLPFLRATRAHALHVVLIVATVASSVFSRSSRLQVLLLICRSDFALPPSVPLYYVFSARLSQAIAAGLSIVVSVLRRKNDMYFACAEVGLNIRIPSPCRQPLLARCAVICHGYFAGRELQRTSHSWRPYRYTLLVPLDILQRCGSPSLPILNPCARFANFRCRVMGFRLENGECTCAPIN